MDQLVQLRSFAESDPENTALSLRLCDELIRQGFFDEAMLRLSRLDARSVDRRWREARVAMVAGDLQLAQTRLAALLEQADAPAIRHDLAFVLMAQGQLDSAENVLAPVITQSTTIPAIGILHVRILHYRRRFDDAVLVAEAILFEQPQLAEAWGVLALVLVDAVAPDRAREAATKALAIDANQVDALTALGTLALWAHDARAAASAFGAVLSRQPTAGRAMAGVGEAMMLSGDIVEARMALSRAVVAMPDHVGTWHALAWCNLLEQDLDAAAVSFEHAMVLDRNFGETHGGVALVHALKGEGEAARQAIKRALRLDAMSRNARYAQSLLWSAEGREREATAMVDGILSDTGINPAERPVDFIEQLRARLTPAGQE